MATAYKIFQERRGEEGGRMDIYGKCKSCVSAPRTQRKPLFSFFNILSQASLERKKERKKERRGKKRNFPFSPIHVGLAAGGGREGEKRPDNESGGCCMCKKEKKVAKLS